MNYFLLISLTIITAVLPPVLSAQSTRGPSLSSATAGPPTTAPLNLSNLNNSGALDIYLKTSDGAPIKGAVITLSQTTGQPYRQLTVKAEFVHLGDLSAPLEFNVRVVAPGYQPAELKVATNDRTAARLVFQLQPISAQDAAFNSRISTLPPKVQKQFGKALDALRSGDTKKARPPLDALQRLAPDHPEVNYLLGVYASKTDDEPSAKSHWTRTLELDPKHLQALLSLCDIYLRANNFDEALVLAERAVQIDPSSWRAQAVLADAYSRKNRYPDALQHAERAVELGHAQAAVVEPLLADLLANSGNKDRAVDILKAYLGDHPSNEAVKTQLARIEKSDPVAVPITITTDDSAVARAATALLPVSNWLPPDVDDKTPMVESAGTCNLAAVVQGAGQRIEELVHNVDRFTATESLFHQSINKWGAPDSTASRKFDYVASIREIQSGVFNMEEYRGTAGLAAQFPDGIATLGLPALALIFHPHNAGNFDLICEGFTHWDRMPVWQIHFRQRSDRPSTIRAYQESLQGPSHHVDLKGRAWIAADSYQLVRLETDLVAPLPDIKLVADHSIIEYGPVHFRETGTDLWLPRSAEVYFPWNNLRMHRIHSFSDYLLFSVGDKQKISSPKIAATEPDNPKSFQPTTPAAISQP
jgi:tetratricopeptide (TPR) repeat protein